MKRSQHFGIFSQKHQSREVRHLSCREKLLWRWLVALGFSRSLCSCRPASSPSPRLGLWHWRSRLRAPRQHVLRLSEVMRSVRINRTEGAMMVPRLLDPCGPETSQALIFRSDLVLSSSPCLPASRHKHTKIHFFQDVNVQKQLYGCLFVVTCNRMFMFITWFKQNLSVGRISFLH